MTKTLLVIFPILVSFPCFSQRIFCSKAAVKSYRTSYSIIGGVKNNILVWTKDITNNNAGVLVFDSDMRLLKKMRQDNFDNASDLKFFTNGDHLVVCSEQINQGYVIFKVTLFDEMANPTSEVILDSIKTDSINKFVVDFFQSPDKKTICFVKNKVDASKNILRVNCSFTDGNNITRKIFGLPFDSYADVISNISIDENQNLYFLKTRRGLNRCILQMYKGMYDTGTMGWTEKHIIGVTPLQLGMLVSNNTCLVYGVFVKPAIENFPESLINTSQIYLWRTDYNLTDAPGDSLCGDIKGITNIINIPPHNAPDNLFYTLGNSVMITKRTSSFPGHAFENSSATSQSLMFDPRAVPAQYSNTNSYSNSLSGTPVMISDNESSFTGIQNSYSNTPYPSSAHETSYDTMLSPVSLNLFYATPANAVALKKTFSKIDADGSYILDARIIRKKDDIHIVYNVKEGNQKNSIKYILLRENGLTSEVPVNAWNAHYNYDFSKSVETNDGLIMPGYHNEKVIFVKMMLQN